MSKAENANITIAKNRRAVLVNGAAVAAVAAAAFANVGFASKASAGQVQAFSPELLECKRLYDQWFAGWDAIGHIPCGGQAYKDGEKKCHAVWERYEAAKVAFLARPVLSWHDVVERAALWKWESSDRFEEREPDCDMKLERAVLDSIIAMAPGGLDI